MAELYREYFDIDPEYFPQVNQKLIESQPDLWKKFYPHETFVKLVKNTISVLSRRQKVSIWVEGAYGTGKSHAVLTLKKLIESSDEEAKEYWDNFPDQLNQDLFHQLQQVKSGDQQILTVHRYGSSDIEGDDKLVFAIQESIEAALSEKGMSNGQGALKDAVIRWISDEANKMYFDKLISDQYRDLFGGITADEVITRLQQYTGSSLIELMGKVSRVASERQIKALSLDVDGLIAWIQEVIRENNLKAILFVWDEFTEFFRRNMRRLTGFQKIVDLSSTEPFYLMIVTHDATHIFPEGDKEFGKIKGRFIDPICTIELPENMAFRLMGEAMTINKDTNVAAEWEEIVEELYDRTEESRKKVMKQANITEKELKKILPIHPYAALLLKHISAAFASNQRSMFDFIKNEQGDDVMGFQYFIDCIGPEEENPFLTVDELWDFFYEKGKDYLTRDIRVILDYFNHAANRHLDSDERRILKTVLLMQAISQSVGSSVDVFLPNEENINNAFEGSDLEQGEAGRIAAKLDRDKILYQHSIGKGRFIYAARLNVADDDKLEEIKNRIKKSATTARLVLDGEIASAIDISGALKQRYMVDSCMESELVAKSNKLRNAVEKGNHIGLLIAFAKDDGESRLVNQRIQSLMESATSPIVIVDASITPLGKDLLGQYVDASANAEYQRSIDKKLSSQYTQDAKDVLKLWKSRIEDGEFIVYTSEKPQGVRAASKYELYTMLAEINRKKYPQGLETGNAVTDTMWSANSLKLGAECGAKQETRSAFRSGNPKTKLENYIGEQAWNKDNYWKENPHLPISKIKIFVDQLIAKEFKKNGRISIKQIYDELMKPPFGFMPCNLSAFVLGFILKEYANSTYSCSDGMTSDVMSVEKLKEMIDGIIKLQITPSRYKEHYIVASTPEERAFIEAASEVFHIDKKTCSSLEITRERIRNAMKQLSFPIWCLKQLLPKEELKTDKQTVEKMIDAFSGIANSGNISGKKTETDIANEIGKMTIENTDLIVDMKALVTVQKCKDGMDTYLHTFEGGLLPSLAAEIGDNGQYINQLKDKFDADAANWVWNTDTADQKIREVILEYRIIAESNKYNPRALTFHAAIAEWCEKCKHIKISYQAAKNDWEELTVFIEMLYMIKRTGTLQYAQREKFLEELRTHGETFRAFYADQIPLFRKVCGYYLVDLQDEEIEAVYQSMSGTDLFTLERSDYVKRIEQTVKSYMNSKQSQKLKALWKSKTDTESPRMWSEQYRMPIICMVPAEDFDKAREAFNTVNQKNPERNLIEKALEYLEHVEYLDNLKDAEMRDKAFSRFIIEDYAAILTDTVAVKDYLERQSGISPFNWYGNPTIKRLVANMAQAIYDNAGCEKALEKIDRMDTEDVKRYLKRLIRENMTVGIEIIKDN